MASREHRLRMLENLARTAAKGDAPAQDRDHQMKMQLIVEVARSPAAIPRTRRKRPAQRAAQRDFDSV